MLLAVVVVFSALPMTYFASTGISTEAGFDGDITLSDDANSYVATMSVDLKGLDAFSGYNLIVDWSSMANHVKEIDYSANAAVLKSLRNGGSLNNAGDSAYADLSDAQRSVFYANSKKTPIENTDGIAEIEFTLNGTIPSGTYPVTVTIIDLTDGSNETVVHPKNQAEYLTATATLTVYNTDGTLSDNTSPVLYQIISELASAASTGSVSFSKTEAEAGETITVTLNPATSYELDKIMITDVTNSKTVNFTKISDTEYTFVMPAGNVQVQVSYKLAEVTIDSYDITIDSVKNGSVHTNGVTAADAGETVTIFVTPDAGYEVLSVQVIPAKGAAITVDGGSTKQDDAFLYTFEMPECSVTIKASFVEISGGTTVTDDVTAGCIKVKGTVLTSNNNPLANAVVTLEYVNGAYKGQEAARIVTGADGTFVLPEVSGDYTYTLKATYDTGIEKGVETRPGFTVYSQSINISANSNNPENKGELVSQTLTVTLYYDWDLNDDSTVERIYAGKDDTFLTDDDYYVTTVAGKTVYVYADENGNIQSDKAYYLWEVDKDGIKERVYVGGGFVAGTTNDYYMYDVDHNPNTDNIEVYIGKDCEPATSDDWYELDVNNDGKKETVYAGADGQIATADDWYISGDRTIYAGEDEIAGTADDWYLGDGDGHDDLEKIYLGRDRLPNTEDDYYQRDVNGDGELENIIAGADSTFNTADDYYVGTVDGKPVNVYPGETGNETDPYEFGLRNDHYDWKVGGKDVVVRVGDDKAAGTLDDEYDYTIKDDTDGQVEVVVIVGEDGVPGTADDYYMFDADNDGELEKVFVGADGIPGTADDYYDKDVNEDGNLERIYAGDDNTFATEDDHYFAIVNTPDGDKEVVPVYAGEDCKFSNPGADPTSDDWYPWDTNRDGEVKPDIYGSDTTDKVFIDGDSLAGTDDDYYFRDADKDGEDEKIFVGPDGMPHTPDDYYIKDVDGDGEDETVYAGDDGIIGTEDDYYLKDPDQDGEDEKIFIGPDAIPGTSDDWYEHDVDGDGEKEIVKAGEDGIIGTKGDNYDYDVDHDGEDETVYVGEDGIPGTEGDWYPYDADHDGEDEQVFVGPDGIPGTPDDYYIKDIDDDGEDEIIRAGEDGIIGTEDDEYDKDVDGDGEDETVYVGPDAIPGTEDDWYYPVITFNAGSGTVKGSSVYSVISSEITSLPSASRGGYTFNGWTASASSTTILTLEQILALRVDTTVYASYSAISYGGGGGGGCTHAKFHFMDNGEGSHDKVCDSCKATIQIKLPHVDEDENGKCDDCGACLHKNTHPEYKDDNAHDIVCDDCGETIGNSKHEHNKGECDCGYIKHIAYIVGKDDGLVHPTDDISRAEVAMIFYRLLDDSVREAYKTNNCKFADVPEDAWYRTAVATLANLGIVVGKSETEFDPSANITRAELATIAARFSSEVYTGESDMFTDIADSWAREFINRAAVKGWVQGSGDGTFRPTDNITRAEVMQLVNNVFDRSSLTLDSLMEGMIEWEDNIDTNAWYYLAVQEATNDHEAVKDENGHETWTAFYAEIIGEIG